MAKLEIIDAEKRAHAAEIESTGLPAPRKQSEIPFGVRAIQSGVEVEGIWISRPNTPAVDSSPNSAKGKGKYVSQVPISPTSSTYSDPFGSPASSRGGVGPQTYRPRSAQNLTVGRADALSQLEGSSSDAPAYNTYQPRGAPAMSESSDDPNSPVSPVDRSKETFNGVNVRVPAHASPVNRHLSNARSVSGSMPPPKMGGGVRAVSGNPKDSRDSATVGDFPDPFATPTASRSPTNTPADDNDSQPTTQGPHVKFAPDEYITSQRYPGEGSSGSSGSSSTHQNQ